MSSRCKPKLNQSSRYPHGIHFKFEINLTGYALVLGKHDADFAIILRRIDFEWKTVLTDTSGNRYKWKGVMFQSMHARNSL